MDQDFILNKWLPALRSGKYKQGKGGLRKNDDTFCCLGVACDIAKPEGWTEGMSYQNFTYKGESSYGKLPQTLATEIFGPAGSCDPIVPICGVVRELSFHNDRLEVPFTEIADALEAWVQEAANV